MATETSHGQCSFSEFTEAEEDDLVGWIQDHPVLYDKSQRRYKDTKSKNKLISQKAKDMADGKSCS